MRAGEPYHAYYCFDGMLHNDLNVTLYVSAVVVYDAGTCTISSDISHSELVFGTLSSFE